MRPCRELASRTSHANQKGMPFLTKDIQIQRLFKVGCRKIVEMSAWPLQSLGDKRKKRLLGGFFCIYILIGSQSNSCPAFFTRWLLLCWIFDNSSCLDCHFHSNNQNQRCGLFGLLSCKQRSPLVSFRQEWNLSPGYHRAHRKDRDAGGNRNDASAKAEQGSEPQNISRKTLSGALRNMGTARPLLTPPLGRLTWGVPRFLASFNLEHNSGTSSSWLRSTPMSKL